MLYAALKISGSLPKIRSSSIRFSTTLRRSYLPADKAQCLLY